MNSIREFPAGDVWNFCVELLIASSLFYPLGEIIKSNIYIISWVISQQFGAIMLLPEEMLRLEEAIFKCESVERMMKGTDKW